MWVKDFDYDLPKELIAQYPPEKREESKLLILHRDSQKIEHRRFYDIIDYLNPGDILVLNETKVIPARLIGKRIDTGGKVEVFLVKGKEDTSKTCEWEVLISPHRAKKVGVKVWFGQDLEGEVKSVGERVVFKFYFHGNFDTQLQKYGQVPLPPYIKRSPTDNDKYRYQTVYAKVPGACAAPTAGLHFTQSIINELKEKKVDITKLVLHTGLGTFKPIKCEKVENHQMESEYYEIPNSTATKIKSAKRVVAVGTTTVRALESRGGVTLPLHGWTDKFIYPPYKFKFVNVLITNFHLPKSTLLLLVSAFAGKELIFKVYKEAVACGYKFYSYGDVMLII